MSTQQRQRLIVSAARLRPQRHSSLTCPILYPTQSPPSGWSISSATRLAMATAARRRGCVQSIGPPS